MSSDLKIPEHLCIEPEKIDLIKTYLEHLDPMQRKTYEIAMAHLGTSFHIEKSNGFVEWYKKTQKK